MVPSVVVIISSVKEIEKSLTQTHAHTLTIADIQIKACTVCSTDLTNQTVQDTSWSSLLLLLILKLIFFLYSLLPAVKWHTYTSPFPRFPFCTHLFTAVVVLALLLPLPMLLPHWLLAASVWIHSSPVPQTNGHTCSGEGQIFCPVTLSTGQAPDCQSALMAANPRATRYSKTLWEYPLINLRDEEIGCPNGLVRVGQDGGGGDWKWPPASHLKNLHYASVYICRFI